VQIGDAYCHISTAIIYPKLNGGHFICHLARASGQRLAACSRKDSPINFVQDLETTFIQSTFMQPMFIFQQTRIILSKHVISSDSIASTVLGGDDNRMQTPAQLL
jgi:hypothetical protein